MISITVLDNAVTGHHSGASVPSGNIPIDDAMAQTLRGLKRQASNSKRPASILWNDGAPALEVDNRPQITIKVNNSTSDAIIPVGESFTFSMSNQNIPDGLRVVKVFGRLFGMQFVSGVATKTLTETVSGEYIFGSNEVYQANTLKLQIIE